MSGAEVRARGIVRVMAIRALLLGMTLGGAFVAALGASEHIDRWAVLGCMTMGFMGGASLSLAAVCEWRWSKRNVRHALAAGLAATAIAFVAGIFSAFEVPYVCAIAETRSFAFAIEALREGWRELRRDPSLILGISLMLAPIFGITSVARTLRIRGFARIVLLGLAPIASTPGVCVAGPSRRNLDIFVSVIVATAVLVPCVAAAADFLEERLRRRA